MATAFNWNQKPLPTSESKIGITTPKTLADKDILAVLDFCAQERSLHDPDFADGAHIRMVRKVDKTIRRLAREAGYILPEGTE